MKKNLILIGIAVILLGTALLKVNEIIGYAVAAIGGIAFFVGIVIADKDKKAAKETIKNSQLDLSKPSYESSGKVLIYDHSSTSYVTQLWYDLNNNCLIKRIAVHEVRDFIPHDHEYKLPDDFLENYTIDDLHYIITTRDILHNLGYQEFIQYNALLISKFKTPFSNGAPLKVVEDIKIEAEKQKQINAQREKERAEYYEFMSKTKHLFFYGQNEYGKRTESVRQDKKTGEYYKVIEIATGRGIGFPPSEPEMMFETAPESITSNEVKILKENTISQRQIEKTTALGSGLIHEDEYDYEVFSMETAILFRFNDSVNPYEYQHFVSIDKNCFMSNGVMAFYEVTAKPTGRGANHVPYFAFDKPIIIHTLEEVKVLADNNGIDNFEQLLNSVIENRIKSNNVIRIPQDNSLNMIIATAIKILETSCAMFTDMYDAYIYNGICDGVSGEATDHNYVRLAENIPVTEAVKLCIDILKYKKEFKSNDWHKYIDSGKTLYPFVKKHTFLIINDSNMSVHDNDKEELYEKCKNNQIRLVNYNNGIFYDYINDYYFKIISEDYPGMVDDAATYREYMFEKVENIDNNVKKQTNDTD